MPSSRDREFDDFVTAAWPRLRRAAYLLSHDVHDAEDLVQTALTRSYVHWARIRRDDAYAYVHRALVNAYIDQTRRRVPVPTEDATTGATPDRNDRADRADGADRADRSVEDHSELVTLLAPLTPRERSIIVWRYYLDASEADVAERLGIAPGTVRSTASRALARLRASSPSQLQHGQETEETDGRR